MDQVYHAIGLLEREDLPPYLLAGRVIVDRQMKAVARLGAYTLSGRLDTTGGTFAAKLSDGEALHAYWLRRAEGGFWYAQPARGVVTDGGWLHLRSLEDRIG